MLLVNIEVAGGLVQLGREFARQSYPQRSNGEWLLLAVQQTAATPWTGKVVGDHHVSPVTYLHTVVPYLRSVVCSAMYLHQVSLLPTATYLTKVGGGG